MSDLVLITGRDPAALARAAEAANGAPIPWVGLDDARAAEATVWFASGALPERTLDLPSLRWIQSAWAGVDRWLSRAEWRGEVVLTRTVADFPERIAEYVAGYLLAATIDVPRARRQQAERAWSRWTPGTLAGKGMLVAGHGAIGSRVASVARALGMTVTGIRRGPVTDEERAGGIEDAGALPSLLPRADVVVNLLPATPATESFWSAARFARLPEGSIFLNASRGACVRDEDLLAALDRGRPALAILDVFREEPLPRDHPYWAHPRVWITPHVAGLGDPATEGRAFGENWKRRREGAPLRHVVERDRGY
ncbi:MAG TPA: D-2-hydroxyacid dehydrogenase [Candidatus Eisenbacteria bacterium]|nr:D-2-hydroxyacid dehydrogenase [Candidatus Eisenbacteria bacterium]